LKILASLAEGPKSFYDLVQREKIASSNTVLKALGNLEKYLLVAKGEPETRNRVPYHLTAYGLVRALGHPNVKAKTLKAFESYPHVFPLIFGKRELYIREGILVDIAMRFTAVAVETMEYIEMFIMDDHEEDWEKVWEEYKEFIEMDRDEFVKHMERYEREDEAALFNEEVQTFVENITKKTLFSFDWETRLLRSSPHHNYLYKAARMSFASKLPYLKVYAKDPELKEFVTKHIEEELRKSEKYLKALKELGETWKALSQ